jgi:hypothetical protein
VAENRKQSFWSTAPGIITAVAALISATGVLIGSLAAVGVIGGDGSSGSDSPEAVQTGASGTSPSSDGFDRITQYGGTWRNDDAAPNTVVRIAIDGSGPLVRVHALGACEPVDCDWGTPTPDFADPLVALFDLGDGHTEKLTMLLSGDATRLDVTEESSVTGTHRYAFHR